MFRNDEKTRSAKTTKSNTTLASFNDGMDGRHHEPLQLEIIDDEPHAVFQKIDHSIQTSGTNIVRESIKHPPEFVGILTTSSGKG
jgi:hypothetical protein